VVVSEGLLILASCLLRPVRRNSVLEEWQSVCLMMSVDVLCPNDLVDHHATFTRL